MTWLVFAYLAVAAVHWGAFISISRDSPIVNIFMALIWPISDLAAIGYAMTPRGDE